MRARARRPRRGLPTLQCHLSYMVTKIEWYSHTHIYTHKVTTKQIHTQFTKTNIEKPSSACSIYIVWTQAKKIVCREHVHVTLSYYRLVGPWKWTSGQRSHAVNILNLFITCRCTAGSLPTVTEQFSTAFNNNSKVWKITEVSHSHFTSQTFCLSHRIKPDNLVPSESVCPYVCMFMCRYST